VRKSGALYPYRRVRSQTDGANVAPICRTETVRWVAEDLRPFSIVTDRWYLSLMKTGRANHYVPSRFTVARDVRSVFVRTRERLAKMLRVGPSQSLCWKVVI
jgi:hypothetical protein